MIDPATAQIWALNDIGLRRYYKDGKVLTGWRAIGSGETKKTCYFAQDSIMVAGKGLQLDSKWYYFYADGFLAKNTNMDDYEIDKNDVRKKQLQ